MIFSCLLYSTILLHLSYNLVKVRQGIPTRLSWTFLVAFSFMLFWHFLPLSGHDLAFFLLFPKKFPHPHYRLCHLVVFVNSHHFSSLSGNIIQVKDITIFQIRFNCSHAQVLKYAQIRSMSTLMYPLQFIVPSVFTNDFSGISSCASYFFTSVFFSFPLLFCNNLF